MSHQLTQKQIARAVDRAYDRMDEDLAEAAEADAGFDGGEWSAGFHDEIREDRHAAFYANVGAIFNLTSRQIADLHWQHLQNQQR